MVGTALDPARELLRETVRRGIEPGRIRTDFDRETVTRLIENAAVSVLDEATRARLTPEAGHWLVMLAGIGAAGMGWREAGELIASPPAPAVGARHTDTGHTVAGDADEGGAR